MPPFWKRARATGAGLAGVWQAGVVVLHITCSQGICRITVRAGRHVSRYSGSCESNTEACGDLGSLNVYGDVLSAYHAETDQVVEFYRIG